MAQEYQRNSVHSILKNLVNEGSWNQPDAVTMAKEYPTTQGKLERLMWRMSRGFCPTGVAVTWKPQGKLLFDGKPCGKLVSDGKLQGKLSGLAELVR